MQKDFVIKAKHAVKRVAAISAGTTLIGATMMGAVAADLGDYPEPFVTDGELNGMVVVGSGADAADIVGAVDIISTLTQATVTGASATTVTEGGEDAEVAIGAALPASLTDLNDEKLDGLFDGEVEWNDTDYDAHEFISTGVGLGILNSFDETDEDMGYTSYLGTIASGSDQLVYGYVFDDQIDAIYDGIDEDNPLTISLLGKSFEITSMTDTTFTYKLADEYSLFVGESITVDGREVTLVNVASGSSPQNVVVTVDGEQETVGSSAEDVNGIEVEVSETFYSDNLAERFAVIRVGDDISATATDATAVELFGLDEDDVDNPWDWNIDLAKASASQFIEVEWDEVMDDLDDDWAPIAMGGTLSFPNDYASVSLDSMTVDSYTTLELNFGGTENVNGTSYGVVEFTTSSNDGLYMDETTEVNVAYLAAPTASTMKWFWQDEDGIWFGAAVTDDGVGTEAEIQYDTNSYMDIKVGHHASAIYTAGAAYVTTITLDSNNADIVSDTDITILVHAGTAIGEDFILGSVDDEETSELTYTTGIGAKDYDILAPGGYMFENPDSNGNGDGHVSMQIPTETVKANIIVSGPGTASTQLSFASVTINSVAGMDIVKLDSEVTDATAKNLILVGGPAVNSLTAQAMGLSFPSYGADSGIPEGAGLLRSIENAFGGSNTALVVAGWDAEDTRNAARFLQAYSSNGLSGDSMTVTGPSTATSGGEATAE